MDMSAVTAGPQPGDAVLWQRVTAGDHDAFGELFDRYAGAVYTYLYRRLGDWSGSKSMRIPNPLRRRWLALPAVAVLPLTLFAATTATTANAASALPARQASPTTRPTATRTSCRSGRWRWT
jgi:hypothetical protein